ncbi:hypothetical protein [Bifidobacterium cuniculi]|uniref:Uncharacterized protein n=1 Tax=Bifidobacterium cuniculi TaxID=1688 RepID=A0A087AWQ0_9BIFI|nr:hypothetical protein [Bifidobacterium cuniculi]KFI63200.1 hypothetical protein BCUN_1126 [Bifidobacterium cuniculi]
MSKSSPNIVLMLVEGESDSTLLVPSFQALFDERDATPEMRAPKGWRVWGSEFRCNVATLSMFPQNARNAGLLVNADVRAVVRDRVKSYILDSDIRKRSYAYVVQVIDLDGAFIPDGQVLQGSHDKVEYSDTTIAVRNPECQRKIMHAKRDAIRSLMGLESVEGIPYRLFYVSRNLEHAFLGDAHDFETAQKQINAAKLAVRFSNSPQEFQRILDALYVMHGGDRQLEDDGDSWYRSWKYVMEQPAASLGRGSNLAMLPKFVVPR